MIELRFKTYTLPMQVEARFKERFDALRARAEAHNVDLWRMFNQGIPDILDGIEQALSTLPEQQGTVVVPQKKRGNRWTKTQPVAAGLEDLPPPSTVTNGAEVHSQTTE